MKYPMRGVTIPNVPGMYLDEIDAHLDDVSKEALRKEMCDLIPTRGIMNKILTVHDYDDESLQPNTPTVNSDDNEVLLGDTEFIDDETDDSEDLHNE